MGMAILLFLLALACLTLLTFGMIKPTKVFLGAGSTRGKVSKVYGLGLIVFLIASVAVAPAPKTEKPAAPEVATASPTPAPPTQPTEEDIAPEATLGVSPEEFRQRLNGILGTIDDSLKLAEFDIKEGSANDTFQRTIGTNVALVGTVSKQSGLTKSLMVIVSGGDAAQVTNAIAVLLATAQAANPDTPQRQVSEAVMDMTTEAMKNIKTGGSVKRTIGKIDYVAGASDATGLMLSIDPTE
jgi:hypothetical protein